MCNILLLWTQKPSPKPTRYRKGGKVLLVCANKPSQNDHYYFHFFKRKLNTKTNNKKSTFESMVKQLVNVLSTRPHTAHRLA